MVDCRTVMTEPEEPRIHLMDQVLASQVAAGEVVERPASVIKELVENSIDAGAHFIRVEIRRGGISLIRVVDDGCGMSRQDAALCLKRHATSKLRCYEDLFDIRQMGFRGEALPSIASVAELRIITRRAQDVEGSSVVCMGGEEQPLMNVGCAPGTDISVANLFYNTPVRRKFLKSEETEAGHIEHQLKLHALAFPEIRFCFLKDGQTVFDVPATHDSRQRIADFFGRDTASELLRIKPTHASGVRVEGYLMPPAAARRNRRMQFVFLNGRAIEDKIVTRAVRDGYGGLPTGLHPGLFLHLEVEPALVDVNVHPAKREVRFRRPSEVTTAIITAITDTLSADARGETPPPDNGTAPAPAGHDVPQPPFSPQPAPAPASPPVPYRLRPVTEPVQQKLTLPQAPVCPPTPETKPDTASADTPAVTAEERSFRFIGIFRNSYALFENRDSLVLLSPRAARERIIFERLMESGKRPLLSQRLLSPELLELDPRELGTAKEVHPLLEQAGFSVEFFGRSTLRIESIPSILPLARTGEFVAELIQFFSCGEQRMRRNRNPFEPFAVQLAERYAGREDMQPWLRAPAPLLADLMRCEIPYCTPTGKPTMLPFTANEINRKFRAQ